MELVLIVLVIAVFIIALMLMGTDRKKGSGSPLANDGDALSRTFAARVEGPARSSSYTAHRPPPKPVHPVDATRPVTAMTFEVDYVDAQGVPTRRRIEVRSLSEYDGRLYIDAWCHLRRDERSFRSDRIRTMINCQTGEIVTDPRQHLRHAVRRHFEPGADYKSVMAKAMPGLRPLIWIARVDHELSEAEMDVLVDFVRARDALGARGAADRAWNPVVARRWIENARPVRDEALGALGKMRAGGPELGLCRSFAVRLVSAGGEEDARARKRAVQLGLIGQASGR